MTQPGPATATMAAVPADARSVGTVQPHGPPLEPALDPFALPSSTSSRFVLLLATMLAATAYAADITAAALIAPDGWARRYWTCDAAADAVSGISAEQVTTDYLACMDGVTRTRGWIGAAALMAVVLVLAVAHWAHPWVIARRDKLRPIDAVTYSAAAREIDAVLVRAATRGDLVRPVRVLMAPFRQAPVGRAFGHARRCSVRLNRGLVRHRTDAGRADLRAVLRHELAHVRNGDVALTSIAVLSTWATAVVATPLLAVVAWREPASFPRQAAGWLVVVAVMVLTRSSVIRAREHYADVRAAAANLSAGDEAFRASAFPDPAPRTGRWARWSAVVIRHLRLHPSFEQRCDVVARPDRLLVTGFTEAFGTGLVTAMIMPLIGRFAELGIWFSSDYAMQVAALVPGALCTAVLGTGLWRQTLRHRALGHPLPGVVRPALGLVAGLQVGRLLSPVDVQLWRDMVDTPLHWLAHTVILTAICLAVAAWFVVSAICWLPSRHATAARRIGLVLGALLMGDGMMVWATASEYPTPLGALRTVISTAAINPLRHLPLVTAAVYLLAARRPRLWQRPGPVRAAVPVSALTTGIAVLVLFLLTRLPERLLQANPEWEDTSVLFGWVFSGMTGYTTVVAVLTALAVRTAPGWLRFAHAFVVTLLAMETTLIGLLITIPLVGTQGCSLFMCMPADTSLIMLSASIELAVMQALIPVAAVAVLVGLLDRCWRRLHRRQPPVPQRPERPRRLPAAVHRAATGLALAVAAVLLVAEGRVLLPFEPVQPVSRTAVKTSLTTPPALDYPAAREIPEDHSVATACRVLVTWSTYKGLDARKLSDQEVHYLQVALALLTSESRALNTFGRVAYDAVEIGDSGRRELGFKAARSYCARTA